MKKLVLGLALALASTTAASEYEITYFAMSQHTQSKMNSGEDYNSKHNFIALEYRDGDQGYSIASFRNSFYKQSFLIDYVSYWQHSANIELSARIGAVTGYEGRYGYCNNVCPFMSVGIAYTANKYFIPKLSFSPGVFILSFSMRF